MLFRPRPILRRIADGALFIASHPGYPSHGFYFREVRLTWKWWFLEVWEYTGAVWAFHDSSHFEWELE